MVIITGHLYCNLFIAIFGCNAKLFSYEMFIYVELKRKNAIKAKEVKIVKEVMACDVSLVTMFHYNFASGRVTLEWGVILQCKLSQFAM